MNELQQRLAQYVAVGPYFNKEMGKAGKANKFIGRGSPASSTQRYALAAGDLANCGTYVKTDSVFVSAEGSRKNRLDPYFDEIERAASSGVTFVTDAWHDRSRPFNYGERQVAAFLESFGYVEQRGTGIWII